MSFNCRVLWLALVIISMYFCVEIGLQSVDRYYTKSTVVGLERDYYYWNTTMPSVTICPLIRLDTKLFDDYCRWVYTTLSYSQIFHLHVRNNAKQYYIPSYA